jgi:glucan phosphoethanolaminetransferase (alkaline phosphatase superfamily)
MQRAGEALLWLILISPWPLGVIAFRDDIRADKLTVLGGVMCLVWVWWLRSLPLRPRMLHLLLLPFVVVSGVEWAMIARFHTRLTASYLNVTWINLHQYPEFLATFGLRIGVLMAVVLVVWFLAWLAIRGMPKQPRPRALMAATALLALTYGAGVLMQLRRGADLDEALVDVAMRETSSPVGVLFQAGVASYTLGRWADVRHQRQSVQVQAQADEGSADLVIFFLGESARAENWSLFGYARETTPAASALAASLDIVPFKGWANSPHTWLSVSSLLSLEPMADLNKMIGTPSIIRHFAAAGYEVNWISTQKVDGFAGPIGEIAAETGHPRFFSGAWDEVLDDELHKLIADNAVAGKRQFVVLHGKGSHFDYSRRYPPGWERWAPAGASGREQLVNGYDNSLRYTDEVIRRVIATAEGSGRRAVLVYVSDHGESLLDDEKQLLGHAVGNRHDLSVPGLFWASTSMRSPEVLAMLGTAREHLNGKLAPLRLMSSDLPHSLLHLAGLKSPNLDVERSVFSASYREKDRWVVSHGDKQPVEHHVLP